MRNINEMSKRALTLLLAFIMVVTLVPLNLLVVAEDGIIGSMVRIVSDTLYMYREAGESAVSRSKNELPETLIVLDVATVEYDSLTKTYYKLGTVDGSAHTILDTYCWTEDYNVEIISDEALLTIDDMEVGVLYKATFKYDMIFPLARVPFFSTYDDYENGLLDDYAVELEILPATVTVTKVSDDDFGYVYVTDENEWPTEYSAYRYVDSNILCIVDGNGAEISVEDMEIGVAYSATWSLYDGSNSIAPIRKVEESESNNYIEYDGDVTLTDEFPTELIVELKYEGDETVYVTNKNWPSWLEQYRYFDIYNPETDWGDVAVTGVYTPPTPDEDGFVYGQVDLTIDGETVSELVIEPGEKTYVFTELGNEIDEAGKYQWQLLIDKENNRWTNISDYYYPYATISEALIANARDEEGKATLRCIVTKGSVQYVSGTMTVTMQEKTAVLNETTDAATVPVNNTTTPAPKKVRSGSVTPLIDELTEFQIEVNYHYLHDSAVDSTLNNRIAGKTVTITLGKGSHYTGDIASPPVLGYKPYVTEAMAQTLGMTFTANDRVEYPKNSGNYYVPAPEIGFVEQGNSIVVAVYYIPQKVNFMVKTYKQNLYDDEYTLADTFVVTEDYAVADAAVGENLDAPIPGFKPLFYDPETIISGDGTTVVDIYYDREYYLVDFDLEVAGGTGYGVVPMYVRYDTQVLIGTPTNPGYTFEEWELVRVYTKDEDTKVENVITDGTIKDVYDVKNGGSLVTVHHNLDYKAIWQVAKASYTIIYWRENADSTSAADKRNYSVWATLTVKDQVNSGTKLDFSDPNTPNRNIPANLAEAIIDGEEIDERPYFTRSNAMSDKSVVIKGDGSTIVNIYYTRNTYHILFSGISGTNQAYKHTHGTDCERELLCHTHDENCKETLICSIPEHASHTADCLSCGKVAHEMHTDQCLKENYCTLCTKHTWSHYAGASNSNPDRWTTVQGTAQEGYIGRSWNYRNWVYWIYVEGQWYEYDGNVAYGQKATPSCHYQHTEDCYKDELHSHVESCYKDVIHTHTNGCYSYVCPDVDAGHTHTDDCYAPCTLYANTSNTNYIWTISAKYGANIADDWPTREKVGGNLYGWSGIVSGVTLVTKRVTMTPDLCDTSDNVKQGTASTNSGTTSKVYYMFESFDQTATNLGETRKQYENGKYYDADDDYSQALYVSGDYLNAKSITGMKPLEERFYKSNGYIYLYYDRNRHEIIFENVGTQIYTMSDVMFEQPLNAAYFNTKMTSYAGTKEAWDFVDANGNTVQIYIPIPTRPSTYEEGSVRFAGWYMTPLCVDGTEFNFANSQMPDANITLFAKWEPTTWNVKVYNDKAIMEETPENTLMDVTKEFGEMIEEPTYTKINDNYIFAGWYYMEEGEEKRFDFNTMQIKKDYVIYAKWTSKVPVPYTVYYRTMIDGVLTDIAEPTVGQSLAGISKSFTAKVEEQLNAGYRVGYYPTARSISIMMSAEHSNEYTFVYETLNEVSYTVHHTFIDERFVEFFETDEFTFNKEYSVVEPSNVSPLISVSFRDMAQDDIVKAAAHKQYPSLTTEQLNKFWSIVTELSPNAYLYELILVTDSSENQVVFEWTNRHSSAIYEVVYKTQNLYDTGYTTYLTLQHEGVVGNHYSIAQNEAMAIQGFTLNYEKSKNTMSATLLKPLEQGGGTTLILYYDRQPYTYTVDYYKRGTMEILEETKTKTVPYGTEVTEDALTINGYHVVSASTVTVAITNQNQSIIFYYDAEDVAYVYSVGIGKGVFSSYGETIDIAETPEGCIPRPNEGYIFAGWYTDPECTIPVSSESAIVNNEQGTNYGEIIPINPTVAPDSAIHFYAKFVPTRLTIQNSIDSSGMTFDPVNTSEQGFIYHIVGTEPATDTVDVRVAVIGNQMTQTILGLPLGNYQVTVEGEWSWRYKTVVKACIESKDRDTKVIEKPDKMTWEFQFYGEDLMITTYPGAQPDITDEAGGGTYFITDNAYSTQSSTTP